MFFCKKAFSEEKHHKGFATSLLQWKEKRGNNWLIVDAQIDTIILKLSHFSSQAAC